MPQDIVQHLNSSALEKFEHCAHEEWCQSNSSAIAENTAGTDSSTPRRITKRSLCNQSKFVRKISRKLSCMQRKIVKTKKNNKGIANECDS